MLQKCRQEENVVNFDKPDKDGNQKGEIQSQSKLDSMRTQINREASISVLISCMSTISGKTDKMASIPWNILMKLFRSLSLKIL